MRIQTNKKTDQIFYTPACEVASQSSFALSFDLTGQQQNKRFYVTEIAVFRVERRDDRRQVFVRTLAIAEIEPKRYFSSQMSIALMSACIRCMR